MIRYRQYRPAFFDGFTNEEGETSDCTDLLNRDFVANFANRFDFYRFSIGSSVETPTGAMCTLMAEYKEGREWWVVAYLWPEYSEELAALPKWKPRDKLPS